VTRSLFSPAYERLRLRLVAARHGRGLTQMQLAVLLKRPQSFVSKYERGERRLDFIEVLEIADTLHIDVTDLVRSVREG